MLQMYGILITNVSKAFLFRYRLLMSKLKVCGLNVTACNLVSSHFDNFNCVWTVTGNFYRKMAERDRILLRETRGP